MNSSYINQDVIDKWFTTTTINPDWQMKEVIEERRRHTIIPRHKDICIDLYDVENIFTRISKKEIEEPLGGAPHFGEKTLDILVKYLGEMPKFGIEVGSFVGHSAVYLGNFLKKNEGTLLCIDTWCGDANMILHKRFKSSMLNDDGDPKMYTHFLNRVIDNKLQETIIPFRMSSIAAARALKVLNYTIDFVYLDSAHECGETFFELSLYYDLLKNGGIIIGDDYITFPAVKHDVDLFCKMTSSEVIFTGDSDTYIIQKK
jgi:predicted O-methyltransferase YrrM